MEFNNLIDSELVPISDYVFFQEGPGIRKSQNVDDGICYLNIRCFMDGRLDKSSMHKVSTSEAYGKYKHFLLDVGDYVVSSSGTLGKLIEVFPEDLPVMLNTSTIRFRPKALLELDRVFLRYFLLSELFQSQVKKLATGSVQLNYGPSHLSQVKMPKVPFAIQKAIVSIAEPIDNKITSNKALIKILEEIAQTVFKSWFIDFDPVKAKMSGEKPVGMDDVTAALFPDSMEDSDLGPIPADWRVGTVSQICSLLVNGSTPLRSNAEFWNSPDITWFKTGELSDGFLLASKESISQSALKGSSVKVLPKGSVLMAIYAAPTVGRLGILTHDSTFNQACTGMLARAEFGLPYLFLQLKNRRVWFNSFAIGAAQQNISKSIVEQCPVVIAPNNVHMAFLEIVSPLFAEIEGLTAQSAQLVALRDALLPRLISGELQIPEEMLVS